MPWPEGGAHVIHNILAPENATNLIRTARSQATYSLSGYVYEREKASMIARHHMYSRPCSEISCIYIFRHVWIQEGAFPSDVYSILYV